MTTAVFTLGVLEQIAYMVLLGRLISMTKEKRPVLFGALGAPAAWDYLVFGFGPGDRFISKLEVHRDQILEEPQLLRLIQVVRGLYVAFLLTVLAWVFVIVSHAN